MEKIDKRILKEIYKKRPSEVKKYDYGFLLVIGGSELYSGSPALSALSAFRAGVDMVRVVAPKRAANIIAGFSPDIVSCAIENDNLTKKDLPDIISMTESVKVISRGGEAVLIGGGMGRNKEVQETIIDYLSQISVPSVIDADGIHAVSLNTNILAGKPFLLTPHSYEFFVLTKKNVDGMSLGEKVSVVKEQAKRLQTTILLKGNIDIISDGENVAINETGSSLMTKGGMGDTLAGIAGAMLARGNDVFKSAKASAYINGLAGEIAIKKYGEGVMATDLISAIPEAIK